MLLYPPLHEFFPEKCRVYLKNWPICQYFACASQFSNLPSYSHENQSISAVCTCLKVGTPKHWNTKTLEHQNIGTPKHWNTKTLEQQNTGKKEHRNTGTRQNTVTREHRNTLKYRNIPQHRNFLKHCRILKKNDYNEKDN